MEILRHCINCSIQLQHLRRQALSELSENMYNTLATWISPTPISRGDIVCTECFACLNDALRVGPAPAPSFGHPSVCLACGISILRLRTIRVPSNCEERNIILSWIPPHLSPHLERVCRSCWMAVKRNMRRQVQQDANRLVNTEDSEMVAVAELIPNQQVIPQPPPLPQDLFQPQIRQPTPKILSRTYKRAAATTRHCVFPGCGNNERLLVPRDVKEKVLNRLRIYSPPNARICNFHLYNDY